MEMKSVVGLLGNNYRASWSPSCTPE